MPPKTEKDNRLVLDKPIVQYLKSVGLHATNGMISDIKERIDYRKGGKYPDSDVKTACDTYIADGLHYARDSFNWLLAGRISPMDARGRLTEHRRNQVLETVLPTLYASLETLERQTVTASKQVFLERSIDHVRYLISTYERWIE